VVGGRFQNFMDFASHETIRVIGYHKICKQRHNVTTMKVKTIVQRLNSLNRTIIKKISFYSFEEVDIVTISKAMG